MTSDTENWLRFTITDGIGAVAFDRLTEQFGSIDQIIGQPESRLISAGLKPEVARKLLQPDNERLHAASDWLQHPGHHLVHRDHPDYPPLLRESPHAPVAVFVAGSTHWLCMPQIAIVGSRSATGAGIDNTTMFATHLANSGFTITSGLALGVDAAAHQAALAAGHGTLAVCGTGLDQVYPARHVALATKIQQQGALISEFAPGTPPVKTNFPRRNRLISGLSLGTLVVEAGYRSGALITARFASEQGREVFAIPGSIHSPQSKGCHRLIKQGAKLIETADEIIGELGPLVRSTFGTMAELAGSSSPEGSPILRSSDTAEKSPEDLGYEKLLEAMGWEPVTINGLVGRTGLTAAELSSMLLIMELDDLVESLTGGRYQRKAN